MWKKYAALSLITVLSACGSVGAALNAKDEGMPEAWREAELALPAYPSERTHWEEIYIDATYDRHFLVDVDSLILASDRSIRYIVNERSATGVDNIRIDGAYCPKRFYKTYALGDSFSHEWLAYPNAAWWPLNSGVSGSHDRVNARIGQIFCDEGMPANVREMLSRIQTRGKK